MFALAVLTCQSHKQASTYTCMHMLIFQLVRLENRLCELEMQVWCFFRCNTAEFCEWLSEDWMSKQFCLILWIHHWPHSFILSGKKLGQVHIKPRLPGLDNDCQNQRNRAARLIIKKPVFVSFKVLDPKTKKIQEDLSGKPTSSEVYGSKLPPLLSLCIWVILNVLQVN